CSSHGLIRFRTATACACGSRGRPTVSSSLISWASSPRSSRSDGSCAAGPSWRPSGTA
ncbi:MAG: hypothetical protein AVDCRST_MAG85-4311, partial [uncultured Solirubrobacteraceae bacterium]